MPGIERPKKPTLSSVTASSGCGSMALQEASPELTSEFLELLANHCQ
jgi:hypothetical protein